MRLTKLEDYPCELHINYNFLATAGESKSKVLHQSSLAS